MVVGGPRGGTRFVANALHRHPAVLVQGEFHGRQMDNSIRLLTETAKLFASEPRWSAGRQRNRRDVLFKMWAAMVKDTPRYPKK